MLTAFDKTQDDLFVVVRSDKGVQIISLPSGQPIADIPTNIKQVHDIEFSPDGQTLLVAGGSPAQSGEIEVWDWATRTRVYTVAGHDDVVYGVAWRPDGKQWASAGWDGVCKVFDIDSQQPPLTYTGHSRPVLTIGYLPDGNLIASAGVDQTIQIWSPTSGERQRTLSNHVGTINDITIGASLPDDSTSRLLSVSEDATIRLWHPATGRLVRFVKLPVKPQLVKWLADGENLVVGCSNGELKWFDVATMTQWKSREMPNDLILKDGQVIDLLISRLPLRSHGKR